MKTYKHYRVGLFIGLLGFNTFSSCVNARQELGMAGNRRYGSCWERCKEWVWEGGTAGNIRRNGCWRGMSTLNKCVIGSFVVAIIGGVGVVVVALSGYGGGTSNAVISNSDPILGACKERFHVLGNATNLGYTMPKEQEGFIMRAVEDGPTGLANSSVTEASFVDGNITQSEPEDYLSGSTVQARFDNTTEPQPEEVKNIKDLGPKTIETFLKGDAFPALIDCMVSSQKLNGENVKVDVNGLSPYGCTILSLSVAANDTESVAHLVGLKEVDVNNACDTSHDKNEVG